MQVPAGKKLKIPFSFVDAAGNAAKVDGVPSLASSFDGVAFDAAADGDGFVAIVDPTGFVGPFSVSGIADVDLGEGKKELTFSLGDHEALASPEATAVKTGEPTLE